MMTPLGVHVLDVVDPAERLGDGAVFSGAMDERMRGGTQGIEFFIDRGQLIILEGNHRAPPVLAAKREDGSIEKQSISQQRDGQAREAPFEPLGQAIKGFELAILLRGVFGRVLDELAEDGKGEPVGTNQLGLKDVMVIDGFSVMGLGQAIRAVAFGKRQHAGPIHAMRKYGPSSRRDTGFGIDQALDQGCHAFLDLLQIQSAEHVVHGVAVRDAAAEQRLKQRMSLRAAQKPVDLPPRPQAAQKHPDTRPEHGRQRIIDVARATDSPRLGDAL